MAPKPKLPARSAVTPGPRKREAAIPPAAAPVSARTLPTKPATTTSNPTPTTAPNPEVQTQTSPKGASAMNNSFENVTASAREQLEKASQTAYKSYEDLSKLQKDNWDAVVAASQIWVKGAENVSKAWVSFAQESMENAATTAKAMVGVKSLREAVDLQTDFAKGNFDKFVAESTKLSEAVVKVANDAMEPITARVNVTVEKLFKPIAA